MASKWRSTGTGRVKANSFGVAASLNALDGFEQFRRPQNRGEMLSRAPRPNQQFAAAIGEDDRAAGIENKQWIHEHSRRSRVASGICWPVSIAGAKSPPDGSPARGRVEDRQT